MALSKDSKRILNFDHFSVNFGYFFCIFSPFFKILTIFFKVNGLISWSYNQYKGIFIRKRNWIKRIFNFDHFLLIFGHFFKILLNFSGKWINKLVIPLVPTYLYHKKKLNLQGFWNFGHLLDNFGHFLVIFGHFLVIFGHFLRFCLFFNKKLDQ